MTDRSFAPPHWLQEAWTGEGTPRLPLRRAETWNLSNWQHLPETAQAFSEDIAPLWQSAFPSPFSEGTPALSSAFHHTKEGVLLHALHDGLSSQTQGGILSQGTYAHTSSLKEAVSSHTLSGEVPEGESAFLALNLLETGTFHTRKLHFHVRPHGRLQLFIHQKGLEKSHVFTSLSACVEQNATLQIFLLTEGAGLSRFETCLHGRGADSHIDVQALSLVGQGLSVDHLMEVHHQQPQITSRQGIRALVQSGGQHQSISRSCVPPAGQKTDSHQTLAALLLGEKAAHFARPELEIWADDVKCAHGSTVGHLDETALYYLRSRGIPLGEARALLMEAFSLQGLDCFDAPAEILEQVHAYVHSWSRERS